MSWLGSSLKRYGCLGPVILICPLVVASIWMGLKWYSEKPLQRSTSGQSLCAISTVTPAYTARISRASKRVVSMMQLRQIPGLSIAVSKTGKLVWSEGFGYADLHHKIPVCPSTMFRVHSISKPFTAAAFMRLVQEGRLDPLVDIRKYVPEFPAKDDSITSIQLATHRSGIRSYRDDSEALERKLYEDVIASLDQFKDDPLQFSPGMDFSYSGYGYVTLSAVIERASGQPFLTYMKNALFDRLEMQQTSPAPMDGDLPDEAVYYDNTTPYSEDGRLVVSPPNDFTFKWAAGGFVSTPEDVLKFAHAHLTTFDEGFLDTRSLQMLFTPATTKLGGLIGWGMGWMIARDLHLRKVYFHFGAGSGGTSLLVIYPRQKVCIAILSNLGHARLPFNDLMSIANQFVPSTTFRVMQLILVTYLCMVILWIMRKWSLGRKL